MESRWYKLTAKAYARGILGYPAAEQRDWRWRMKENMVLDAIEDELITDMNRLSHHWHCSAAQVTGWDEREELFNYHKRQASYAYNIIGKATLPWYKNWKEGEVSLGELWKQFKAMEKDPVYAARLAELHKGIKDEHEANAMEEKNEKEAVIRLAEMRKKQEEATRRRKERAKKVFGHG